MTLPSENQQTVEAHAAAFLHWAMADDNRLSSWLITREEARDALRDLVAQAELAAEARGVIDGLMEIAGLAMPDTYYASDSRVVSARALLARLDGAR